MPTESASYYPPFAALLRERFGNRTIRKVTEQIAVVMAERGKRGAPNLLAVRSWFYGRTTPQTKVQHQTVQFLLGVNDVTYRTALVLQTIVNAIELYAIPAPIDEFCAYALDDIRDGTWTWCRRLVHTDRAVMTDVMEPRLVAGYLADAAIQAGTTIVAVNEAAVSGMLGRLYYGRTVQFQRAPTPNQVKTTTAVFGQVTGTTGLLPHLGAMACAEHVICRCIDQNLLTRASACLLGVQVANILTNVSEEDEEVTSEAGDTHEEER